MLHVMGSDALLRCHARQLYLLVLLPPLLLIVDFCICVYTWSLGYIELRPSGNLTKWCAAEVDWHTADCW
jgi:hypothetical protein